MDNHKKLSTGAHSTNSRQGGGRGEGGYDKKFKATQEYGSWTLESPDLETHVT